MIFFLIGLLSLPAWADLDRFQSLRLKGLSLSEEANVLFTNDEAILDIAVDGSNNIYIAGYTKSAFSNTTSQGFSDCFVAKYNNAGTQTWIRQIGTPLFDSCMGVTVDASGNVFAGGITEASFTGQTSAGGIDSFIVKFNSSGTQQWVRQFGTSGTDIISTMVKNSTNQAVAAGGTTGTFPGETNAGGMDAFFVRYNTNGVEQVLVQTGTSGDEEILDMSIDSNNRSYVTGYTSGAFDGTNQGFYDAFALRIANNGVINWARQIGSSADDYGVGIGAINASGNPAIIGTTEGTLSGQTSAGGIDIFIAEYNTNGAQQWLRQTGTSGNEFAIGGCADSSGNYYFAGTTDGTWSGQTNSGLTDFFLMKYNGTGVFQFARQFGSSNYDYSYSLSCTNAGVIYHSGASSGSMPGFTSKGGLDGVFSRYSTTGTQQLLLQLGSP